MSGKQNGPKRITIRDVARLAGVSVGAASAALSRARGNSTSVSERTRERVLEAAQALRYRPLSAARAMAGKAVRSVGVLATEYCMVGSFYGHVLRGIANECEERDCGLLLRTARSRLEMESSRIFREREVDGVIIPADAERRTEEALRAYDIPHVWVNTELHHPLNCVHAADVDGTIQAVKHLVQLGHRRVGFLHHFTGERHHVTMKRERGYLLGLRAHGLAPLPSYERCMDIEEHVELYLRQQPRPTALIAYSDAMALLTCNALLRRGLRIPEDMSVVGHEGVVVHEYGYRKLTTVAVPVEEMGRTAVRMLLAQLETQRPAPSVVLPVQLAVHESTAPPPQDAQLC